MDPCPLQLAKAGDLHALQSIPVDVVRAASDKRGSNALHWAAGSGRLDTAAWLMNIGLSLDSQTSDGRRPLHYAARNGQLACVEWLVVGMGADADCRDAAGCSPLQFAVWQNRLDVVRWLIQSGGCDAHQRNLFGCTLAHWACLTPRGREGGRGAMPEEEREKYEEEEEEKEEEEELVIKLIRFLLHCSGPRGGSGVGGDRGGGTGGGVDFNERNSEGHSPLSKAAYTGHAGLCRFLRMEPLVAAVDHPDNQGSYVVFSLFSPCSPSI